VGTTGSLLAQGRPGGPPSKSEKPVVPITWDEEKLATPEVPLAQPGLSARHVSKEYYESTPLRPICKSYDVYLPDREPKGYLDWLGKQEPEVVWDATRSPALTTEADWVKAGEAVFYSPIVWGTAPSWGRTPGCPCGTRSGTSPYNRPSRGTANCPSTGT